MSEEITIEVTYVCKGETGTLHLGEGCCTAIYQEDGLVVTRERRGVSCSCFVPLRLVTAAIDAKSGTTKVEHD